MKLFRAWSVLIAAALLGVLFVKLVPQAYALSGVAGVAITVIALSALSAPFLSWSDGRAHANTFTNLISDVYAALDVVSRERTGFLLGVQRDPRVERCALNANALRSGIVPANGAIGDITPAMSIPSAADQTIGNKSLTITKARFAPFSWSGEDQLAINSGAGYLTTKQNQVAQAIRGLLNEAESDLAATARKGASRATGTAGTTPFASNLSDTANVIKIFEDNGAPESDNHLVINTTAGANIRSLAQLTKANEAGDVSLLRQGTLLDIQGFSIRTSGQLGTVTKGTGTSYQTNNASGYAVGATSIAVDTGSGTILAGDVVTFAGDTNKYVVATALSGGTLVLAEPGLRQTLADNVALTVGNNFTPSVAFNRNAILFGTRLPALPEEGDLAKMRETIIDPRTGIAFELAVYPGFRMVTYHLSLAWGQVVVKPEHVALLLG